MTLKYTVRKERGKDSWVVLRHVECRRYADRYEWFDDASSAHDYARLLNSRNQIELRRLNMRESVIHCNPWAIPKYQAKLTIVGAA